MTENDQAEKSLPMWLKGAGVGALGGDLFWFVFITAGGGRVDFTQMFWGAVIFGLGGAVGSRWGWKGIVLGIVAALGVIVIGAIVVFLTLTTGFT